MIEIPDSRDVVTLKSVHREDAGFLVVQIGKMCYEEIRELYISHSKGEIPGSVYRDNMIAKRAEHGCQLCRKCNYGTLAVK
jgi:hypothetical protein